MSTVPRFESSPHAIKVVDYACFQALPNNRTRSADLLILFGIVVTSIFIIKELGSFHTGALCVLLPKERVLRRHRHRICLSRSQVNQLDTSVCRLIYVPMSTCELEGIQCQRIYRLKSGDASTSPVLPDHPHPVQTIPGFPGRPLHCVGCTPSSTYLPGIHSHRCTW